MNGQQCGYSGAGVVSASRISCTALSCARKSGNAPGRFRYIFTSAMPSSRVRARADALVGGARFVSSTRQIIDFKNRPVVPMS